MAPSAERDCASDDETSIDSSSSNESSRPIHALPSTGPPVAHLTRISKGLSSSNIISTPKHDSSRLKAKNNQTDLDQWVRRSTRGSVASDEKNIKYDMKHHPMDNVLRPKATAKRIGMAIKSESPEETPQSLYKKRQSSPVVKIQKKHVSESPSPDIRHSTRIGASGKKVVNYDMTHHPMDDVLRPKATAKKSVHFANPQTQEIMETPTKALVKKRKGSPPSVRKKQDKARKMNDDLRIVATNTETKAKDEPFDAPNVSRRLGKAKVDIEIGPSDDPREASKVRRDETEMLDEEMRPERSVEASKMTHNHKTATTNNKDETANRDSNSTVNKDLNNPFSLAPFTTWKGLEDSNRLVYLLQKGAPLDTETLPCDWSTIGNILVSDYMSEDNLTSVGGLAAVQIRYEQIRVEMQQYYGAAAEPAYEEDWPLMYVEDFDVYDLKGSATKYWKPSDAKLVPRRNLQAFRNVGTPPEQSNCTPGDCVLGTDTQRRPESLPTSASMIALVDQAPNLSGLDIHETGEQVAMNLIRSELCGEIESLMSSGEISKAFDEHANETTSSVNGPKPNTSSDPQAPRNNSLGNGTLQGLQPSAQDMEDLSNVGPGESSTITKIVTESEADDSQRTALAKSEGLYPILQYNLGNSRTSSGRVEAHTVGELIGTNERHHSQYLPMVSPEPAARPTYAAASFTAVNSSRIHEEASVLKAYKTVAAQDVAQQGTITSPQLLQELEFLIPNPNPKTVHVNPSVLIRPSEPPFNVHQDQTAQTPIIRKLARKHPIPPSPDVPRENLDGYSEYESENEQRIIPTSTIRPGATRPIPEDIAGYQTPFRGPLAQNPVSSSAASSSSGTDHTAHAPGSSSGTYGERVIRGRGARRAANKLG